MTDEHKRLARDMTVREAFAQAAMNGLISAGVDAEWTAEAVATMAVEQANALVAALNQAGD